MVTKYRSPRPEGRFAEGPAVIAGSRGPGVPPGDSSQDGLSSAVAAVLARDRLAVEELLRGIRAEHCEQVKQAALHLLLAEGKRARPLLTCAMLRAAGFDPTVVMPAVIPVELIHAASLIHDDLLDRATTRRGRPTVHQLFGAHTAVLAGDFLLARALELLARSGTRSLHLAAARAVSEMVQGQVMESEHAFRLDVPLERLRAVNRLKTASLFRYAARAGALLAKAPAVQRRAASRYGRLLGEAFQLADDVLDWEGCARLTGKMVGRDLAEGKPTAPLRMALLRDPGLAPAVRAYWRVCGSSGVGGSEQSEAQGRRAAGGSAVSGEASAAGEWRSGGAEPTGPAAAELDFETIRCRVVAAGGVERARAMAVRLAAGAVEAAAAFPRSPWRELLGWLALQAVERRS